MPEFELYLFPPAEEFLKGLAADEQRKVASILELIRGNPYVDGLVKFHLPMPPAVFYVYISPDYSVTYRQTGNVKIQVYAIAPTQEPKLPR